MVEGSDVRFARALCAGLIAAAFVAGCGGDSGRKSAQTQQPQRTAPTASEPQAADGEAEEEYRYDPTGKPDPFRSFVLALQKPTGTAGTTPLERFDLSQLYLTGIIWATERPRALVKDPSGKAYIVGEGTPIGKNEGRVVRISDNAVTVKETYVDFLGKATTKDIELRLRENQGG